MKKIQSESGEQTKEDEVTDCDRHRSRRVGDGETGVRLSEKQESGRWRDWCKAVIEAGEWEMVRLV